MEVLLLGVGPIGIEYAKILKEQGYDVLAIGRSVAGCEAFAAETGVEAHAGGLTGALDNGAKLPGQAIVAVSEGQLGEVTRDLLHRGVGKILVEKPGGLDGADIRSLAALANGIDAAVYVGYNRRFHASTLAARGLIDEDGGVTSFHFEFTEWAHRIEPLEKEPGVKENWFLQNSSHVVDLAFHLGGWPSEMVGFTDGTLSWHPVARYSGAGRAAGGALFSYIADWQAPGRWSLEFLTRFRRFIFRPMETLQVQALGSVEIKPSPIDDTLDQKFKPGFYRQTEMFLNDPSALLTIQKQVEHLDIYAQMHPRV